ncbi:hypothetical protein QCA50_002910 [Cerrena zonata]|uniref:Uncharacterized protein n=1 Tax=Cerrena zonata TaxID=2478898 RepID=A0AAW0GTQ0_9APHY
MEKLLKGIEDDQKSILSSRSSGDLSSIRTITGIGATSSKAIVALGEALLQCVDVVRIRSRLRAIEDFVQRGEDYIPSKYYEELLEFQRYGLYSKSTRHRAWDILLLLMERRRTEVITDIVSSWPAIETQLMIRQLSVFKLSGWTLHPARLVRIRESSGSEAPEALQKARQDSLAHSYRNVLGCVLKQDPAIIHEVLEADEYVYLQTPLIGNKVGDVNSPSFAYVFEYLGYEYELKRPHKWELPLSVRDFVDFLSSGPSKQCSRVLDYSMQQLRSLSQDGVTPAVLDASNIHPALPYLWFSTHLAMRSKSVCQRIVNGNMLDILRDLWKVDNHSTDEDEQIHQCEQDVQGLCCILLGVISHQRILPKLATQLLDFDPSWFLHIFPRFISEHEIVSTICLPLASEIPPDDRSEFYRELLFLASKAQVPQRDAPNVPEVRSWEVIMEELGRNRRPFLTSALASLPSQTLKVMLVRKLVEMRLTSPKPERTTITNDLRFNGVRQLVRTIHTEQPSVIYAAIDIASVAFIQTESVERPTDGYDALRIFFETYSYDEMVQYNSYKLPPPLAYYAEYATRSPKTQRVTVIQYILRQLRDDATLLAGQDADIDNRTRLLRTLQLLQFTFHLAHQSEEISTTLVDSGILGIIFTLWTKHVSGVPIYGHIGGIAFSRDILRIHCLVLLGILALRCPEVSGMMKQEQYSNFLAQFNHVRILSADMWLHIVNVGWYDLSSSIQPFLLSRGTAQHPQSQLSFDGLLLTHPWKEIVLPARGNHDTTENMEKRIGACEEVLKFCVVTPQESWWSVMNTIFHPEYTLHLTFKLIILDYLCCDMDNIQPSVQESLRSLNLVAMSYGYEVTNPVDRFLLFFSVVCSHRDSFNTYVFRDSGITKLVDKLRQGAFDFCGPPDAEQRLLRHKECVWLLEFISVLENYPEES